MVAADRPGLAAGSDTCKDAGALAPPRRYWLSYVNARSVWCSSRVSGPVTGPGTIARVADRLGVYREAFRTWIREAGADAGKRLGITTSDAQPHRRA